MIQVLGLATLIVRHELLVRGGKLGMWGAYGSAAVARDEAESPCAIGEMGIENLS